MPFLRFDFADAAGEAAPLVCAQPREVLVATSPGEVEHVLAAAERAAHEGRHAAGFVSYDAAPAFDPDLVVVGDAGSRARRLPLAWFAVFDAPDDAGPAMPAQAAADAWQLELAPETSAPAHAAAVQCVRDGIAAGDFYQVNLTQRLRGLAKGDARRRYERYVGAGAGGYSAYIDTGEWQVVSLSPELFFRRTGDVIVTRPMKGTAPRGLWSAQDDAAREALARSAKDRAENVMIVDLLRNDLGRVAETGSVKVTELFSVESYPTVHQMTSTVAASLRPRTTLLDLFRALFPSGSITGAPKIAAMQAIARLEPSARGLYCGAIGVLHPGGACTFNVAIRTLVVHASGAAEYGVGGAVTWDSVPAAEHAEMLLKARVLETAPWSGLGLIETLRLEDGIPCVLDRHAARMSASARYFGFADPAMALREQVGEVARRHPHGIWRVRAVARRTGEVHVTTEPFTPVADLPAARAGAPASAPAGTLDSPVLVALSARPVSSTDVLLYHKTTHRSPYESRLAEHPDAWDVLLVNERGELTEFTRGNVVLELDGASYTPPLASGLLGGILRGALLEEGRIRERVLTPADLHVAARIWFVNALRGWVEVRVAPPTPAS